MKRTLLICLTLGGLGLTSAGCAPHTSIMGEGRIHEQVVYGTIGVTGEGHRITLLPGSDVRKLSIMGEDNRVIVEDGAIVQKIEVVGEDNKITCPADMEVVYSSMGDDNRLEYRRLLPPDD